MKRLACVRFINVLAIAPKNCPVVAFAMLGWPVADSCFDKHHHVL